MRPAGTRQGSEALLAGTARRLERGVGCLSRGEGRLFSAALPRQGGQGDSPPSASRHTPPDPGPGEDTAKLLRRPLSAGSGSSCASVDESVKWGEGEALRAFPAEVFGPQPDIHRAGPSASWVCSVPASRPGGSWAQHQAAAAGPEERRGVGGLPWRPRLLAGGPADSDFDSGAGPGARSRLLGTPPAPAPAAARGCGGGSGGWRAVSSAERGFRAPAACPPLVSSAARAPAPGPPPSRRSLHSPRHDRSTVTRVSPHSPGPWLLGPTHRPELARLCTGVPRAHVCVRPAGCQHVWAGMQTATCVCMAWSRACVNVRP